MSCPALFYLLYYYTTWNADCTLQHTKFNLHITHYMLCQCASVQYILVYQKAKQNTKHPTLRQIGFFQLNKQHSQVWHVSHTLTTAEKSMCI